MPNSESSPDLNNPLLHRPKNERLENFEEVNLEELAREIWVLLKTNLREENDRVGRV